MKIYLDNYSLQRPLDSKSQIRIALEAEAVLGVLTLHESRKVELISSEVLVFEIKRTPSLTRKEYALEALAQAESFIVLNDEIGNRAREIEKQGIKPMDALHLASAEAGLADYFCTCDDKFLKRAKTITGLKMKVMSPIELIGEVEAL